MDKETLSNYGWIVVLVLILAVMLALATPFGTFIAGAIKSTTAGLFSVNQATLGSAGIDVNDMVFENCDHVETEIRNVTDTYTGDTCCKNCGAVLQAGQTVRAKVPEGGKYTAADGTVYNPGDEMPEICTNGDVYTYTDYRYTYKEAQNGWHVVYIGYRNTVDYILESINGKPITDMTQTYAYVYRDFSFPSDFKIPATVTIMNQTFFCAYNTTLPQNLVIPEGVTEMYRTFSSCHIKDASTLILPSTLVNMKETFQFAQIHSAPKIPSNVQIMYSTFFGCSALVNAPDMSEAIGVTDLQSTFQSCTSLTTTPDMSNCVNVSRMGQTFDHCTSLTKIQALPSKVTTLYNTFWYCTALNNDTFPVIPNSVTTLQDTFKNCTGITDISKFVIPNSVTTMSGTFANCTNLTDISGLNIPNSVTSFTAVFEGCTGITDASGLVIPDNVKSIAGLFRKCTNLITTPNVPNTVANMNGTFQDCTSLVNAPKLPSNLQYMEQIFKGCTSLTSVVRDFEVHQNIANMKEAFSGCTSLKGSIAFNTTRFTAYNPSYYLQLFSGVDMSNIVLTGSTPIDVLNAFGNTGNNWTPIE